MAWQDKAKLYSFYLRFLPPYLLKALVDQFFALVHRWTYKPLESAQNIVIIGGSFTRVQLARILTACVPTGYRVVLIERNSHFHYSFNFPRYSVLQGHERKAFIPYDGITSGAPEGAFELVHGEVVSVKEHSVILKSGKEIGFAYLAIATGSWQPSPSKLNSTERDAACEELRQLQRSVESAETIAVVGGGAVGVELAGDIASYYPKKDVFEKLGIRVVLSQRPRESEALDNGKDRALTFTDGRVENFDLLIACTGLKPNTTILSDLSPDLISSETGRVLVQPTLQVATKERNLGHVYSLGDVAETSGPKMARAAFFQTKVVRKNIMSMMKGRPAPEVYTPRKDIEGALKLTLGKDHTVVYSQQNDGTDLLIPGNGGSQDLEVERAWKLYGAVLKDLPD